MKRRPPEDTGAAHDWRDDFDKALDRLEKSPYKPAGLGDAAVYVHDTLKLAWVHLVGRAGRQRLDLLAALHGFEPMSFASSSSSTPTMPRA